MPRPEGVDSAGITCGLCWRAENLTPEQRDDPANRITGTMPLCEKHQAVMDAVGKTFFAVVDHGHFSQQSQAEADRLVQRIGDLHEDDDA